MPVRNVAEREVVTRSLIPPATILRPAIARAPADEWLANSVIAAAVEIFDPEQRAFQTAGGLPAGDGDPVGALIGLRGVGVLASATTARMTLDADGLNGRPCLRNAASGAAQYYTADGLAAGVFSGGKAWSVLLEIFATAVGATPGQQTVFCLGNSAQNLDFSSAYLSAAAASRFIGQRRAQATTIVASSGGWLDPGLHYFGVTFDGTSMRVSVDGADWGPTNMSTVGAVTANRVTLYAQRLASGPGQYLTANSRAGRTLIWDRALSAAEMSSAVAALRTRSNGYAIDLFQEVDRTAGHNGFGALGYKNGLWVQCNRRGTVHASSDGALAVRTSPDFINWTERAVLTTGVANVGYQDERFLNLPDGSVGLYTVRWSPNEAVRFRTWLHQSFDGGLTWDETPGSGRQVGRDELWKWCIRACPDGLIRSIDYNARYSPGYLQQARSRDGINWQMDDEYLTQDPLASEADMAFDRTGKRYVLSRRDGNNPALYGSDLPPYQSANLDYLNAVYMCPDLLMRADGRLFMAARPWTPNRCIVGELDKTTGALTIGTSLPGSTDAAYPRGVFVGGYWYFTFYGVLPDPNKPCQYVARVRLPD